MRRKVENGAKWMKKWEIKNWLDRNWRFWSGFGGPFWAFCETNSVGSILGILDLPRELGGGRSLRRTKSFGGAGRLNTIDEIAKQRQFGGLVFAQQACPNFRWKWRCRCRAQDSAKCVCVSFALGFKVDE